MMIVASHLLFVLAALAAAGAAYLVCLPILAACMRATPPPAPLPRSVAVIIPAHNEAAGIGATIRSVLDSRRGHDLSVYVVADNCTDDTARIASLAGALVLTRNCPERRGKGYALEWAIDQINIDDFYAVLIVDADTEVASNFLDACLSELEQGADVVQCRYIFRARNGSLLSRLQEVASAAEDRLFFAARSRIGLPVLLRGNGMCFRSSVLKQYPMRSHSLAEDVDYAIDLIVAGIVIRYTTRTKAITEATATLAQSSSQKLRWAAGTIAVLQDRFSNLLRAAVRQSRPALVETALSLLLMSRPSIIAIALVVAATNHFLVRSSEFPTTILGVATASALCLYLSSGIFFVDDKLRAGLSLLIAPAYIAWLIFVQIKAAFTFKKLQWVRTRRDR